MKIGISGANSFIGRNIVEYLMNFNIQIILVARRENRFLKKLYDSTNIEIHYLDMDSYYKISDIIPCNLDAFIHLSWAGTRGEDRNDFDLQKRNFDNSLVLYKQLELKQCKTFISFGSQAEYGIINSLISETTTPKPQTAYGIYKLKLAKYICANNHKMRIIWFRIFSAYGIYDYSHSLIMSVIRALQSNQDSFELTSGDQNWNYINVYDIAKLTYISIIKNSVSGIYNLASDDNRRIIDFVKEISTILGSKTELLFGSKDYTSEGKVSFIPSNGKMKKDFEYNEFLPFHEGIENIIKKMEENNE